MRDLSGLGVYIFRKKRVDDICCMCLGPDGADGGYGEEYLDGL
jgi:hypothetical protein